MQCAYRSWICYLRGQDKILRRHPHKKGWPAAGMNSDCLLITLLISIDHPISTWRITCSSWVTWEDEGREKVHEFWRRAIVSQGIEQPSYTWRRTFTTQPGFGKFTSFGAELSSRRISGNLATPWRRTFPTQPGFREWSRKWNVSLGNLEFYYTYHRFHLL